MAENKTGYPSDWEMAGRTLAPADFSVDESGFAKQSVIVPAMTPTREGLRESLARDIAAGQQTVQQTQSRLGIKPAGTQSFVEKGIRIAGKTIAQDEYQRTIDLQQKAVKDYINSAGFANTIQANQAENMLNDQMNKVRLDLINRGLKFEALAEKNKLGQQEKAAMYQAIGGFAKNAVMGYVGG